jgi:hypothetical protein
MRKLLELFSVKDPGWGNSSNGNEAKGSGDGEAPPAGETKPAAGDAAPGNGPEKVPENTPAARPPARPSDGPPDLDELWRDFNNRLNNFFGGKKDLKTPQTIQAISRRIMRHSISPLIMAAVEIRKHHLTLISIIPFLAK